MAAALKRLISRRALAEASVRLKAWWDGTEVDPEALAAALAAAEQARSAQAQAAAEPESVRLAALCAVWGDGRIAPGSDEEDRAAIQSLDLDAAGVLAVLGPGLEARVKAASALHAGAIRVYEWRDDCADVLADRLKAAALPRCEFKRVDLETVLFPKNGADALVSIDDVSFCDHPPRMLVQIAKALKPGRRALVEGYFGAGGPAVEAAFATGFAEAHLVAPTAFKRAAEEAGLDVQAEIDTGEPHLATAKAQLAGLPERLAAAPERLTPIFMRELVWELESWTARRRLVAQGGLLRRRFVLQKR